MLEMLDKIFKRKNKRYKLEEMSDRILLQQIEKINIFKNLVSEIDIKKYTQKEYAQIVNLIYLDVFRTQEVDDDTSSD
tara:strand:+ start:1720 stop:1953 length:234 start_codon:yes stop_codon:yes gene_type:complete